MNIFNSKKIEGFFRGKIPKTLSLSGLNHPLKLLLINYIKNLGYKILFVAQNEQTALNFQVDLKNLCGDDSAILPFCQTQFYEDVPTNRYIYKEQLDALFSQNNITLMPAKALFEKFPDKEFFKRHSFEIKKGEEYDYAVLRRKLTELGYKSETLVQDIGEFSLRGDILDVYTYSNLPVRVEFFGDTVEDIRYFDPNTQKSVSRCESVRVLPLYKFLPEGTLPPAPEQEELWAELSEKLTAGGYFEGIEYYAQYFNKNLVSALDYFKDYVIIYDEQTQIFSRLENLDTQYKSEFETPSVIKLQLKSFNHNTFEEISAQLKSRFALGFDTFMVEGEVYDFNSSLAPNFSANIEKIVSYVKEKLVQGAKIYLCTNFKIRVQEILREHEIFSPNITITGQIQSGGSTVSSSDGELLTVSAVARKRNLLSENLVFLTDKELFNQRQKPIVSSKYTQNKQSADYIESINDIKENEYIVHNVHGIGIYRGLSKQEIDGFEKDYLTIEFFGSDKLYMPAEQVNLLVRYRGEGGGTPKLSKMGGSSWESAKNRVKKEVEEVALELLNLYARREMAEGITFEPDTTWQVEMEEAFEFVETPDQMKAIVDTKADMEASKPMDRLVCADVGFGKTEVAIRAIFKCVMSGKQALMIAPTTILSLQHFQTIQERFKPFSINVELLSRFRTKKEQKEVLEKLAAGTVDVVIGTHRLLQDDILPKSLGLLVIDEEHRFGVKHKDKLKQIRTNIDILSLSATPIPRTLNMALSGLKDMSVINTPPKNRLPVRTHVGERNEKYLKNAIEFELSRDGQVFYLYNRINSIYNIQKYLSELVPSARIAVAHGQMGEGELEKIMLEFAKGAFDILLCTTIIESGLDIPNANTIIIDDCDRFGLAQLYQLRGRVGRSDRQAFCYCFYKASKELNEEANKRLAAIKEFTSLGSGYLIALRDIEIRGVGNILGAKQHGHMASVGFDTYCSLLEETVNELKSAAPVRKKVQTIVDINVTAFIPDDWVGSTEAKMLEYKKLSDVKTLTGLEEAALSLKDRFSKLPQSVENLIKLIKLRLLASENYITKIQETPTVIRLYTPFSRGEWELIRKKLKPNITKYFTFQNPPKALIDVSSIILMSKNHFDFDKIFNILSDLLYDINDIVVESFKN